MKRLVALVMALVLSSCLFACVSLTNDKQTISEDSKELMGLDENENLNIEEETTQEITSTTEQDLNELVYTFKDPRRNVVFDYPEIQVIEEATSRVFCRAERYIIVYCRELDVSSPLASIPDELLSEFQRATSTYIHTGEVERFLVDESEELKVKDTAVLKIDGEVETIYEESGEVTNLPMRAYVFEKDGGIFGLFGVVTNFDENWLYEEMTTRIDAMILTLRDEK